VTPVAWAITLLVAGWVACIALAAQGRGIQDLPPDQAAIATPLTLEKPPRVFLEVRLAETEPVRGLAFEATVKNSAKKIYVHYTSIATHVDVIRATAVENNGHYDVAITFDPQAAGRLASATAKHAGRPVAIIIDGEVAGLVTVGKPLGGQIVLAGSFTQAEATRIAAGLERW
jgi:preprotein translocase subunit SecD